MKKTILEWFEELPEPVRSQAIENYDGEFEYANSMYSAIAYGFCWSETEQGYEYWFKIHAK